MAGIYIHIPFCKKACHYCDFHFSTSFKLKDEMINAIIGELELRRGYLSNEEIETIYIGGGTPTTLEASEIQRILDAIADHYPISYLPEVTIEANPENINQAKLKQLRNTPINRFSLGIQSFFEEDLRWMNRSHTANEGLRAIKRIQDAGFRNISIDLIYGYPLLSNEKWMHNLDQALMLSVSHLSAYSMTVEPGTPLNSMIKSGNTIPMDEDQTASQFERLMMEMEKGGFTQYEISNFGRESFFSKHNSNYWNGKKYLGIGPSAHSYNGHSRSWNVKNNHAYLKQTIDGKPAFETEQLSKSQKVNEYIMTSLRTIWGCDLYKIQKSYGNSVEKEIRQNSLPFFKRAWLSEEDSTLKLSKEGKFFADKIAAELFVK